DHLYALFKVRQASREGYDHLPVPLRRNLDAYTEGVRDYLADHPGEVPVWLGDHRPEPQDLVGFEQLFVLLFPVNAFQGIGDCQRGGVTITSTLSLYLELLRAGGPAGSSTAWALAPARTAEHVTILHADPHNLIDIPTPEFRLHAGGLELSGHLFGAPVMLTGHT